MGTDLTVPRLVKRRHRDGLPARSKLFHCLGCGRWSHRSARNSGTCGPRKPLVLRWNMHGNLFSSGCPRGSAGRPWNCEMGMRSLIDSWDNSRMIRVVQLQLGRAAAAFAAAIVAASRLCILYSRRSQALIASAWFAASWAPAGRARASLRSCYPLACLSWCCWGCRRPRRRQRLRPRLRRFFHPPLLLSLRRRRTRGKEQLFVH